MSQTAPVRLSAPHFYLPLIHTLAVLSGYEARKPVHMDDVIDAIIELTGVNPDDYGIQASSNLPWVRRWIYWAFRNNQNKPAYEAKFGKGKPGTTTGMGKRQWALTDAGLKLAHEIRCDYDTNHNYTAEWLGEALATTNLLDQMHRHLAVRFGLSAKAQRIEDHVQEWLAYAIERDLLAEPLKAGQKINPRSLCEFAANSTRSELRSDGQDAHMRTFYGALTARDREEDNPRDVSSFHLSLDTSVSCLGKGEDGKDSVFTGSRVVGPVLDVLSDGSVNVEDDMLHALVVERCMDRLAEEVNTRKAKAQGRYGEILDAVRIGISTEDLAEREGVTANRASNMKATLMATLRKAVEEGDLDDVYESYFGGGFI